MKVISVVGTKKTGKTTLVCALVAELARYGRVGTVKNMASHPVDQGDTRRHFDAGADVVVGLGQAYLMVKRDRGDLDYALKEMQKEGMDYVVVEGFKHSHLAKIIMGDIEAPNALRRIDLDDVDPDLVRELADAVRHMADYGEAK
ncbi:MAG: molybdopterin-guanine dinucleotide biosynthesis protein B [Methanothrix sp.]